jgi:hypothetical protein
MSGRRGRLLLLCLGVVAAVAGIVALTAWVVSDEGDASTPSAEGGPALAADARELARQSVAVGHAVYWVGPKASRRYELTQTGDGRAYVRYLPLDVQAGDPRPGFLTVGTYLVDDAFAVTRAASRRTDARAVAAPAGAVAFYATVRPQSVYLAFEGSDLQIEVYDPTPRQARKLVETASVRPVG